MVSADNCSTVINSPLPFQSYCILSVALWGMNKATPAATLSFWPQNVSIRIKKNFPQSFVQKTRSWVTFGLSHVTKQHTQTQSAVSLLNEHTSRGEILLPAPLGKTRKTVQPDFSIGFISSFFCLFVCSHMRMYLSARSAAFISNLGKFESKLSSPFFSLKWRFFSFPNMLLQNIGLHSRTLKGKVQLLSGCTFTVVH